MSDLPTGLVTFLFTDIEGSTLMLDHLGVDIYHDVLRDHDRILRESILAHGGLEVRTVGDAFFIVFTVANAAVACALSVQQALSGHAWPEGGTTRVRIGMHTGEGRRGGDNYIGLDVNKAARVCAAAHGGQVLASQQTRDAAALPPGGASWRSLGRHRLKDLGNPVEIFQLDHPELDSDFSPPRSLESVKHNLPIQPSSFLGRSEEMVEGASLLRGTRLLSITGPGGTGKTRLSYQIAAEQAQEFADGVWVTELAPVSEPSLVPASLLSALGLRDEPGRSATATVISHLRTRRALIVLDNCEHVVEAAAALVDDLLRGCDSLRVMATTREPLRVSGETVWALRPLHLPTGPSLPLEVLAASDAVSLFCARAAEASAGFAFGPENADRVARICARLEGIPLAIELAAARVRALSLDYIADHLDRSLDLLSKGVRGADRRQASLRGAIDWSHDLLMPAEQLLFRRLSVFAGGFTIGAAETVGAGGSITGDDVLDLLEALVDKSLVVRGDSRPGEGRYSMLETIRTYALEKLADSGEEQETLEQYASFYSQFALDRFSVRDEIRMLDQLDEEHSNLLAALEIIAGTDRALEHGKMVTGMWALWNVRGHWPVAYRESLRYIERPDRDRRMEGFCRLHVGDVCGRERRYDVATAHFEDALRISRQLGDSNLEAQCIGGFGMVAQATGDLAGAQARFRDALDIARELEDPRLRSRWAGSLGAVTQVDGDLEPAETLYEEAVAAAREAGSIDLEGKALGALASLLRRRFDLQGARTRYEEAAAIARQLGDRMAEFHTLNTLSGVAIDMRDPSAARRFSEEALAIARETGNRGWESMSVGALGAIAADAGDDVEAQRFYIEALAIARESNPRGAAYWLGNLGRVAARRGDYETARANLSEALTIGRESAPRDLVFHTLMGLGEVAIATANYAEARERIQEAHSLAGQMCDLRLEAYAAVGLGTVALATNDVEEGRLRYNAALGAAVDGGDRVLEGASHHGLGSAGLAGRDLADARREYLEALRCFRDFNTPQPDLLVSCAKLLLLLGRQRGAVRLLGAREHMASSAPVVWSAIEQERYAATREECRQKLGDRTVADAFKDSDPIDWKGAAELALELLGVAEPPQAPEAHHIPPGVRRRPANPHSRRSPGA